MQTEQDTQHNSKQNYELRQQLTVHSPTTPNQKHPLLRKAEDFIKKLSLHLADTHPLVSSLSENNYLKLYTLDASNSLAVQYELQSVNPLYDCTISSLAAGAVTVLAYSQMNYPISLLKVQKDEGESNTLQVKSLASISDIKPNTEMFHCPLQLKFNQQDLLGCGKGFTHIYDLNSLRVKNSYQIAKRDVISCMDVAEKYLALGKFGKTIDVYAYNEYKKATQLFGHVGGVTSVKFSKSNPNFLYSCARKDDLIYSWDLRMPQSFLEYFERKSTTNQRLYFDLSDNAIVYGHETGHVTVCDAEQPNQILSHFEAHNNEVVSNALFLKGGELLLTTAGQRHFEMLELGAIQQKSTVSALPQEQDNHSDTEMESEPPTPVQQREQNSIKLWAKVQPQ